MLQRTRRAESPAGNGMVILQDVPFDPNGNQNDAVLCSQIVIIPTVVGQFGQTLAVTPGKLSRAGMVAMVAAINTLLGTTYSAAQLDQINTQLSGGLGFTCTPLLVTVPVPPGAASATATSLATVLSTGGNVIAVPPLN